MKRILGWACALAQAALLLLQPVVAASGPVVSLSSGEVSAGGTVTLDVSIRDNPGLAACLIYIYFDTTVFEVDPGEDISAAGSFRSSGGLIGNSIAIAKQNGRYDGAPGKDGVLALWYNGSGLDTGGDGKMMTVTLRAKETAASGDYRVELGYSSADTCNQRGEDVKLNFTSGSVAVAGTGTGTETETGTGGSNPGGTEQPGNVPDPGETETVPEFTDISGNWAESYIRQAAERGLVIGYEGLYRPNDTMTRAEFVTILWRVSGSPQPSGPASFTDLTRDWYKTAIAWAEENNVVNGMGGGKFEPEGSVTREQLVTILHRLAGTPTGMEAMLTSVYDGQYPDSGKIGSWAKAALYWSIYNSIYCGQNSVSVGKTLAPDAKADRAQIAVMTVRYLDSL